MSILSRCVGTQNNVLKDVSQIYLLKFTIDFWAVLKSENTKKKIKKKLFYVLFWTFRLNL